MTKFTHTNTNAIFVLDTSINIKYNACGHKNMFLTKDVYFIIVDKTTCGM